ncbi:hypothetical protein JCM8097_006683 [Rhodosporidiobolus ruineniae]
MSSSDDEEKLKQPLLRRHRQNRSTPTPSSHPVRFFAAALLALGAWHYTSGGGTTGYRSTLARGPSLSVSQLDPVARQQWEDAIDRCEDLHVLPGVPDSHWNRTASDRFVPGTTASLIRNATVWTGEHDGKEILYNTDVLLDRGVVVKIGENLSFESLLSPELVGEAKVIDAHGAWVTPGIVDMHSHVGVDSLPQLRASDDTNSLAGAVLPHLRSLDGINGHDLAYRRIAAGGITTTLVLPGSANNVGGQAFVLKLRPTAERTIDSRIVEMPWNVKLPSGERRKKGEPSRWRHMKMACGENIRRVYGQTRLDLAWNFRSNFDKARTLKNKQDAFCSRALQARRLGRVLAAGDGQVESFPDDLQLEALVDVLRGKVKVNTHCYETTDLNAFIRHTHEFQFPISAFHHAHETFLVPALLKQAWPGNDSATPAVALFSTNGKYKREAWRDSPYAGKVLTEAGINLIYKSDHPVSDSRHLVYQAAQGHHFGVPAHLALSAVTTTPARTAGLSHRVGYLRKNYDADVVLWSSHPLSLGATPSQVWIDGIAQLVEPHALEQPKEDELARQNGPEQASLPADHDPTREQEDDGFEFLNPGETERKKGSEVVDRVRFVNVGEVLVPHPGGAEGLQDKAKEEGVEAPFEVVVEGGRITCLEKSCAAVAATREVDLKGGSLLPSLVGYGGALGLAEIVSEKSTLDGSVLDPLYQGGLSASQQHFASQLAIQAVDGLAFGGKHLKVAEEAGVGRAVAVPQGDGFFLGVSTVFRTSAKNVLEKGAIVKKATALHVQIGHSGKGSPATPSISTQIAYLRNLLLQPQHARGDISVFPLGNTYAHHFAAVAQGWMPLVVRADKADVLATLVSLKKEVEKTHGFEQRWVIHGAQEAHLVAPALAAANIGVILSPPRSLPSEWDTRRGLPGPPLTREGPVEALHEAGVKVAIGFEEEYQARALLWEAAWAQRLTDGRVSRREAIEWVSSNLEELLGFGAGEERLEKGEEEGGEWVAFERDPFEFGSRVVAASTADHRVKLFL